MTYRPATLIFVCALLAVAGPARAKGAGHSGGGHSGGGHSGGGHSSGHRTGHGSGGHHSVSGQALSNGPTPRHRPGIGQPPTGSAVPRSPIPVTPPVGGGLLPLPSFPLFGLSGGFGFSSYAGWPIVGANPSVTDLTGGIRLLIDPASAEVIVDGYYAGIADDFTGRAHPLWLAAGAHHIELLAPGYQSLAFDLMIQARHTIRFAATLARSAP